MEFQALSANLVRNDGATREGLATPAMRELVRQAQPFAEMLEDAEAAREPGAAAAEPAAEPAPEREPQRVRKLREGMVAAGLGADLADAIVDAVLTSAMPFASPARLRTVVRDELALRLPVAPAAAPGRRVLAVVGPAGAGKTAALARIAAAHAAAGTKVACLAVDPSDGGAALRAMLEGSGVAVEALASAKLAAATRAAEADLVLIDTPAAWPGSEDVKALGKARPDEVHLALRAGTAAAAGAELLAGLEALSPNRLLVTAAAETGHLGGVLDVALRARLALGYVAAGPDTIAPADARALASRVTP